MSLESKMPPDPKDLNYEWFLKADRPTMSSGEAVLGFGDQDWQGYPDRGRQETHHTHFSSPSPPENPFRELRATVTLRSPTARLR